MGKPTQMSKRLEPMELDTAMSPRPFLATITLETNRVRLEHNASRHATYLVIKSGMLVPAASTVSPMTSVGIPKVTPIVFAHHTMR